jgi:hypothetical protein
MDDRSADGERRVRCIQPYNIFGEEGQECTYSREIGRCIYSFISYQTSFRELKATNKVQVNLSFGHDMPTWHKSHIIYQQTPTLLSKSHCRLLKATPPLPHDDLTSTT